MKSRKGFTLVELIGVIILIGIITLIAIPSVDYIINKTKDNAYEATVKTLMDGLRNWTTDNKELVYEDGTEILLTLTDLKEQGYVDFDIRNPKTKLCLANNMQFKITRVKSEEKDKYEFEIMGNELLDGTLKDCEAVSKTPSIYLLGDNPQKIEITNDIALGYEAYDPGVVAKSTTGEDLTHSVVKTNDVKLNILSKNYHAKYTIIENGISKTVTRKVHIVDTTAPELHVPEDLEIELGETLNLLEGVTATDNSGETPKIKTSGNVNFNKEGEYKVTYIATDSSGNSVSKDRVIKVLKPNYILQNNSMSSNEFKHDDYRDKIVSITFKSDDIISEDAVVVWDLSETSNNSIIGYLIPDPEASEYYKMYVGSKGEIKANSNSSSWFYNMQNLIKIDFSNFDTSNVTNMSSMFRNTKSLAIADFSNFDTSNVTNMSSMFYNANGFTNLDLSNFDTSNVTNMSYMFTNANGLVNLDLSKFDTSSVTTMQRMFSGTQSLETINVRNFDTSNVTNMSGMFGCTYSDSNCQTTGVKNLDLSNFNTSNVTNMSSMFAKAEYLSTLNVSGFNTSSVTNMSNMFYYTKALASIDVSSFNTSNVTNMSSMFMYSRVENLDLSNFNTSSVTNMGSMFHEARNLKRVDLSSFNTSNVTNMSGMFSRTSSLETIDVSNFDTSKVTNMSGMFGCFYGSGTCYKTAVRTLDLSNFDTSKVTNMSSMFRFADNLTSLDLSSFNTSNVTDMSNMFHITGSLQNLNISSFDTSKVTTMQRMFCMTKKLETIDVSNFDTSNVTDMSYMFGASYSEYVSGSHFYVTAIKSLDLSNFNTSKVKNMAGMFGYAVNLTSLDLSSFDTSSVTNMSNMFFRARSLKNINLSSFDTSNVTNMSWMFSQLSSLETIDVSNFNTSKVTNMSSMFGCTYGGSTGACSPTIIKTLDLSNFDASSVTSMERLFDGLTNLTTIKTPKNISSSVAMNYITSYDFTGSDGNTYTVGTFPTGNTESITLTR